MSSDEMRMPPKRKSDLTPPEVLARHLKCLLGRPFLLSGKTRTDGSRVRKLISSTLAAGPLPPAAGENDWRHVPPKRKGVPRLLREFVDTFIVTSGDSYNLQVWNRNPSEPLPQVEYGDGAVLRANDVQFILARVDPVKQIIKSIVIASPEYIVHHFGRFGKPTVKQQLIITNTAKQAICSQNPPILFYPDYGPLASRMVRKTNLSSASIHDPPSPAATLSLSVIRDFVSRELIGRAIEPKATKNRGQELEAIVASGLGYHATAGHVLIGGYPDIRHQALEVKIQDAPGNGRAIWAHLGCELSCEMGA